MSEIGRVSDPTVFVLYGATGDLARRMVLPAFFRLAQAEVLPHDWRLIGRGDVSHDDFRGLVHDALAEFGPQPDEGLWEGFCSRLRFAGGGFSPKARGGRWRWIGSPSPSADCSDPEPRRLDRHGQSSERGDRTGLGPLMASAPARPWRSARPGLGRGLVDGS